MNGINFADYVQPPLAGGNYKLTVSQNTNITGFQISDHNMEFTIAAQQLNFNSSEIYSVYPPKSSSGQYGRCLAHIVLQRRTIPWEINLDKNDKAVPWIALLVFSDDENVVSLTDSYETVTAKKQGVYIPVINRLIKDNKDPSTIIDIPSGLFFNILPKKEDLKLLAHTRYASLDEKVTDPSVKEGWFSCVVANRYPKTPEKDKEYVGHSAYLVSLEGFENHICYGQTPPELKNSSFVRMFSLACWKFNVSSEAFDFPGLAKDLNIKTLNYEPETTDTNIKKLFKLGYWPMNHQFREGSYGVSWYRSALIPQQTADKPVPFSCFADSLLKYDPELGMFDISLSSAWQLGRLLTLRQPELAKKILSWRHNNKIEEVKAQNIDAMCLALNTSTCTTSKEMERQNVLEWKQLVKDLVLVSS